MDNVNKKNISVIGLGSMGFALAETLLKADFNISVWNRTSSKAQKLENKGANICSTPNEAFKNSQYIVASLSNYEAWNNIIDSNQIDMDLSGKTIIQLTTGSIEEVTALNDWVKKYNGDLLEGIISCFPSQIGTEESLILLAGSDNSINNCKDIISILSPQYKNLGSNLIAPTVLSRAFLSGALGGLIGMMNGAVLCQKADISLDDFKEIYMDRSSIIEQESKRIIDAIATEDTENTEASVSAWGHGQEALLAISKTLDSNIDFQLALNKLFKKTIEAGLKDHDLSAMHKIFNK
jgi:3-hydroxyisobutyrate dehydrogenase-like beta-hydroxyacid dehydrogenase